MVGQPVAQHWYFHYLQAFHYPLVAAMRQNAAPHRPDIFLRDLLEEANPEEDCKAFPGIADPLPVAVVVPEWCKPAHRRLSDVPADAPVECSAQQYDQALS